MQMQSSFEMMSMAKNIEFKRVSFRLS